MGTVLKGEKDTDRHEPNEPSKPYHENRGAVKALFALLPAILENYGIRYVLCGLDHYLRDDPAADFALH